MTLDRDSLREQLRSADQHWESLHPAIVPSEMALRLSELRQRRVHQRARRRVGLGVAASLLLLAVAVGFWRSRDFGAAGLTGREPARGHAIVQRNESVQRGEREFAGSAGSVAQLQRDLQLVLEELAQQRMQQLELLRDEIGQGIARAARDQALQQQLAESRARQHELAAIDQPIDFGF